MIDWFLALLLGIYLAIASIQDLRKREVWNWLSFSLAIFALAYRAFYAVFYSDFWFFAFGVLGFLFFLGIGYLFYYSRIFAGGDAKLLFSVGAVLPVSVISFSLIISGMFLLLLLFSGSLWGLLYSFFVISGNFKGFSREFRKNFSEYKLFFYICLGFSAFLLVFLLFYGERILLWFPLIAILFPILYIYGKAIENSCMIKLISIKELTIGDWLANSVKIGKKVVKPDWEGISEDELKLLRKYRGKIKIKQGIPFVPGFFIAFLALIYFLNSGGLGIFN